MEDSSGIGELLLRGRVLREVRYRIRRYQGVMESSGLPIPGLYRIEGSIDFDPNRDSAELLGASLGLKLADGRVLGIIVVTADGRVLSEGHGPSRCLCC